MARPVFEGRVYFPRIGGVVSSLDTHKESYLMGNDIHYRTVPKYKCKQLGSVSYYDFQSVVFRVINVQNSYKIIVDKDEAQQEIKIWVGGTHVLQGKNLTGTFKHISPPQKLSPSEIDPRKYRRRTGKLKIIPNTMLIIVDTYDWAWDIASKELLKAMPDIKGKIVNIDDYKKVDPLRYNVVMVYPWGITGLMDSLDPRNTVVCVAGGEQLDLLHEFNKKCGDFNVYGACNKKIQARLKKEFPTKTVLHLIHGVNHKLFTPIKKRTRKEFTVGWVGSTQRGIKRYTLAVEIAAKGRFKLHVASFKKYPHSKMPRFYRGIDVLLVTSITEAHPMIVYEAMSCGVSVVATDVGDISQYITHGENGFILPVNASVKQFVETINKLKNAKLRARIGEEARKTVIEKLSWHVIVKQYLPLQELMKVKTK